MKTDKLIRALRDWAEQIPMPGRYKLLTEAADRLEELDERVAIMMEGIEHETRSRTPDVSDLR